MNYKMLKILIFCPLLLFGQIDVSISDINGASYNESISIPINTTDLSGQNIIAFLTKISYDPEFMEITGVSRIGTLSEVWSNPSLNLSNEGEIQIAAYGIAPLSGEGVLINLEGQILESELTNSIVSFEYFFVGTC